MNKQSPWECAAVRLNRLSFVFAGSEISQESLLLHGPFARKPKRIRTAFSPSQLLRLERAFEKNHYVVGAERKQLANTLSLSETQFGTVAKLSDVTWEPLWLRDASFGSPRTGAQMQTKHPCSMCPSPLATPSGQPWKGCCSGLTVRGSHQSSSQICFRNLHIPSTRGDSDGDLELLHHRPLCTLFRWLLHLGQAGSTPTTDPWWRRAVPGRDPSSALNRGSVSQTQLSRFINSSSSPDGLQPQALHPFSQPHLLAWKKCTTNAWVLATVHSGYSLQF
ncbi:UNVERIFIED_CONTAM: hypothetical protein FKN15_064495 [Acipenser sinensis]